MSNTAVVQLQHREAFERNVTRALVAGAGAGVLALLTQRLHVPMALLALVATSLACVRGDKLDKLMLGGLSVVLPALPWLFGFSTEWTIGLAGAAAGVLMVKSRLAEKGEEGSVASERPGAMHYALTAAATGGLAVAGAQVAAILLARMQGAQTPQLIAYAVSGTVLALFAALGSIGSHIALTSDPVEARCEEVIATLDGEFRDQAVKALTLYRHCGQSLAALPRDASREELARTVQKLTKDAMDLAVEWAGVETQLHEQAHTDLAHEVADLKKSALAAKDPVARRQLELAAQSLLEEIERLEEMKLKRERILAKLKSQVALLERARVSLIGMRSSHASVRAAELSAVARKLNALALSQADEARLAHSVATNAELNAQEAQRLEEQARKQVASATPMDPQAAAPVAPVGSAHSTDSAPVAVSEPTKH